MSLETDIALPVSVSLGVMFQGRLYHLLHRLTISNSAASLLRHISFTIGACAGRTWPPSYLSSRLLSAMDPFGQRRRTITRTYQTLVHAYQNNVPSPIRQVVRLTTRTIWKLLAAAVRPVIRGYQQYVPRRVRHQIRETGFAVLFTIAILPVWLGNYISYRWVTFWHPVCYDIQNWRLRNYRERRTSLSDASKPICAQVQSTFLHRLPLEVRQQIYEECYKDLSTRIIIRRTFITVRLVGRKTDEEPRDDRFPISRKYDYVDPSDVPRWILSLPLSCRQAYEETISYLYSCNFLHVGSAGELLELQRALLPRQLQAIRALNIDWCYHPMVDLRSGPWSMVMELPKLQKLWLRIPMVETIDDWAPAWELTHLKDFQIEFQIWGNWRTNFNAFRGAPFRLRFTGKNGPLECPVRKCNAYAPHPGEHYLCDMLDYIE